MKKIIISDYITKLSRQIHQLSEMIAVFETAQIMQGLTQKEREACELLRAARLKLIEAESESEAQP